MSDEKKSLDKGVEPLDKGVEPLDKGVEPLDKGVEPLDLRVGELMEMQKALYEKNPHWGAFNPAKGIPQMLWMVGELGEVIDVVKKAPEERYMGATEVREHFVEEFVDVLMYFVDTLLCYGITAEELSEAYKKKFEYNMVRDYVGANKKKYGEAPR